MGTFNQTDEKEMEYQLTTQPGRDFSYTVMIMFIGCVLNPLLDKTQKMYMWGGNTLKDVYFADTKINAHWGEGNVLNLD